MKNIPEKLLELKNDLVFQKLFGKPKNSNITSHFLSLILKKEIHNIDLDVNKRMLRNRPNSKTGRLDIRAKFNNGEDCNIELQVLPLDYMPERMLEYWSGMYDNKISSGQGYEVLKPSISILITDYKLKQTENIPKYHTIWNLREKDYTSNIITNNIEMHILEIPKIKNNEIQTDELVQWLKFIENPGNKEVQKFMKENKYLKQAKEELAYLSDDPDFQLFVESRAGMLRDIECMKRCGYRDGREDGLKDGIEKGIKEGLKEGIEKGLEEGSMKEKINLAKKMKAKNMPLDDIIELTGLTKEKLEEI